MVVFYALVGNDVCNPHPGSHHMTSPAQFKFKVLEALRYLDNGTLPHGSHVVFIGVGLVLSYLYLDFKQILSLSVAGSRWTHDVGHYGSSRTP